MYTALFYKPIEMGRSAVCIRVAVVLPTVFSKGFADADNLKLFIEFTTENMYSHVQLVLLPCHKKRIVLCNFWTR